MKWFYAFAVFTVLALSFTNLALVAEVVYVDIVPDKVVSPPVNGGESFSIDFDDDDLIDFSLQINNFDPYKSVRISGILRGNQIAGDGDTLTEGNFLPLSINKNVEISPSQEWLWFNDWDDQWDHGLNMPIAGFGLNEAGHWTGSETEKYLAVRFITDEGYHYGWIEIQISELYNSCTIKGYAYETEVDEPINAGEIGTGVNDFGPHEGISMYPNPAQNILNIQSDETSISEIELFNLLGVSLQLVSNSNNDNTMSISTEGLPNGLYYCKIRGERRESVRRFAISK